MENIHFFKNTPSIKVKTYFLNNVTHLEECWRHPEIINAIGLNYLTHKDEGYFESMYKYLTCIFKSHEKPEDHKQLKSKQSK